MVKSDLDVRKGEIDQCHTSRASDICLDIERLYGGLAGLENGIDGGAAGGDGQDGSKGGVRRRKERLVEGVRGDQERGKRRQRRRAVQEGG